MVDTVYEIVEHDGGWAYKLGGVYSETFMDRDAAAVAAERAAAAQRVPGDTQVRAHPLRAALIAGFSGFLVVRLLG